MIGRVQLYRFGDTPHGVFGELVVQGSGGKPGFSCWTLEDRWVQNRPNVSCIPAGWYALAHGTYHRGGYDCWEVRHVVDRSLIKLHKGNTEEDVRGCIVLGARWGPGTHPAHGLKVGVWDSGAAYSDFMAATEHWAEGRLVVSWRMGG